MAQYAGNDVFPASADTVNDGTGRDAASVNVGIEALLDRTMWLRRRALEFYSHIPSHTTVNPVQVWNSFTPAEYGAVIIIPDLNVGDVIDAQFTATALHHQPTGADDGTLFFRLTEGYGGSPADHNLSSRIAMPSAAGNVWTFGATMRARHTIIAAGTVRIAVLGQVVGTLTLWRGLAWVVTRTRGN
jgi:hypothetical protein